MNTKPAARTTDAVAAYASVEGAERAVAHLVRLGYDEHDLGIGPRDFEAVDPYPFRRMLGRGLRWGTAGGAGALTVFAVGREIGFQALRETVLPLVAWGAAGGLLVGLVTALVAFRRYRATSFLSGPDEVAPTRFEVVVGRDQDEARHGLATWWDPAAPPAGWQQPA